MGPLPARGPVVAGALCGLAWAAGFRSWMAQMVGPTDSSVSWWGTFGQVLVPGMLVGAALGLAEHRRRAGGPRSRLLTLAPVLFLGALTDPEIFRALRETGEGAGAIFVVLVGLAGGFAGSGRGRAWGRRTCGVLAVLGSLVMLTVASDSVPLGTARGVWVGLLASSLVAVWCLACTVPWRIASPGLLDCPRHAGAVTAAVGALVGLAWACTLRSFLDVVAGGASEVTWAGTFGGVLLPGAVAGAALATADRRRRTRVLPPRHPGPWSQVLRSRVLVPLVLATGAALSVVVAGVGSPVPPASGAWLAVLGGGLVGTLALAAWPAASRHDPPASPA